jgi:uncharacterized protein (TIGR00369 family)
MSDDNITDPLDVEPGGFQQLVGYDVLDWGPGHAVLAIDLHDGHGNRHGYAHGGLLMTILDAACTRAGAVNPETGGIRRTATVSMTTNFVAPAKDCKLRAVGRKTGGGRRIFFAAAEVYDEEENLIASAVATCRYA